MLEAIFKYLPVVHGTLNPSFFLEMYIKHKALLTTKKAIDVNLLIKHFSER
jgi:hypothetical protein